MNFQHSPKIGKIFLLASALLVVAITAIIFLIWPRNNKQDTQESIPTESPPEKTAKEISPTRLPARQVENFLNNYKSDTEKINSLLKKSNPLEIFNQTRQQLMAEQPATQPTEQAEPAPVNFAQLSPEQQALKTYGNALGAVIKKYGDKITAGGDIFKRAIENADEKILADLKTLADLYRQIYNEIVTIEPPEKVSALHTSLAKTYADLATAIEKLAASAKDSKIPPESFVDYSQAATAANQKTYDLMAFFKENGIVFQPNEPGYIFYLP